MIVFNPPLVKELKRLFLFLSFLFIFSPIVYSQCTYWKATSTSQNATTRSAWLTAIGETPDYLINFESGFVQGQDINGSTLGALGAKLTNLETSASAAIEVLSSVGSAPPIGNFAGSVDDNGSGNDGDDARLSFTTPVSYVGFYIIDLDAGSNTHPVIVNYSDGTSCTFNIDGTLDNCQCEEFLGIVAASGKLISNVEIYPNLGSRYGIDNIEYGIINCTPPSPSTPVGSTICVGGSATLTSSVTGTSPITHQWQYNNGGTWANVVNGTPSGAVYSGNTGTSLTVSGISTAGSYQYRIRSSNSCGSNVASGAATVTVSSSSSINITPSSQTLCSGSTINLSATATGGVGTCTIQWQSGSSATGPWSDISGFTGSTFSSMAPGINITLYFRATYTCTGSCQSASNVASVVVYTRPSVSAPTVTQPTCAVPTGTIVVNATLTSGVMEYSINGGSTWQSSSTFSGLSGGTYNIVVRRQGTSCSTSYGTPVVINTVNPNSSINITPSSQTLCSGSTINLSATATGGVGTCTIQWQSGSSATGPWSDISGFTGSTFSSMAPGINITLYFRATYTCSDGCQSASNVASVVVYTRPSVSAPTVTQPTCAVPTGTIVVNATLTSGVMEYSINGGSTWQSSSTFSGLSGGTYNIVVRRQGTSCSTSYGTPVVINSVSVPVITVQPVSGTICSGDPYTFSVTAIGVGLSYQWKYWNGIIWANIGTNSNTLTVSPTVDITYYVEVTSSSGCMISSSTANIVVRQHPVVSASTVTQPTCAVPTGTIVVNATGSGTLEYSINGGTTWVTTNTFSGLAPGNYTPRVRLQSSPTCSTTGTAVTINAVPVAPVVSASTVTQPTCAVPTGTIVVNATGSGTLEYSINGGTTWVTTNTFTGLAPGSYTPRVRLQSSPTCSTNGTAVTINSVPALPNINTAPSIVHPSCVTSTGSITISATGGSTLEYSINAGVSWQTSNTFTGLAPGSYDVYVRLQNSTTCVKIYGSNPVVVNPVPTAPVINSLGVTQPTCAVTNGTIVINATGSGVLEYRLNNTVWQTWQTSNIFAGLPAGTYEPNVRLQNNPTCVAISSATINGTPSISELPPTVVQPTCAVSTGTITLNASASSGTIEYRLDSGPWQTSPVFSGLAPGFYASAVRIQNNPTCTSSSYMTIINSVPVLPDIYTAPTVTHPTCAVPTGTMVINATGSSTLEYSIDNGATWTTNNTFTGLAPGTFNYYVQVRLQSTPSCVKIYGQNPVVVNPVPTAPLVSAPTVTQPTCAVPTGTIVVNATGSGTLEYSINGGTTWVTTNTFSGLAPGAYTPRVRLQSSPTCSRIGTAVTVNAVPVLPNINTAPTVTPVNCSSSTSGGITINATGSGTLEYSIDAGATWQTSNIFTGLAVGSYNVYVRLQSSTSCVKIYGSNPIVLAAPSCRDFTPTIEIDNITFLPNTPARDFVINISELLNGPSVGQIVLKIPKISAFTYGFSPTTTNANVNGVTVVNNSAWTKTENLLFITLTLNTGQVLSGFGINKIGMTVQRNQNVPTQTNQPMTVTIVDGTGGDLNPFNNTYNVVIKAQ